MRIGKLDTRFTMILSGKFLDNYTAGLQRYVGANENELYSIPLSYTDGQGKFNLLKDLEIGYNNSIEPLRLKRVGNEPYDVKQFPVGKYDDLEVDFNVKLIDLKTNLMMMKDAREQVSITHTSYLQNETQEIKFYRFMPITNLGFMIRDVELSDDLTLTNIEYVDFTSDYDFEVEEISTGSYKVKVISNDVADFELGIVFINEFDGQYTLVGALKNPIINGNVLEFYVTTTMAGLKPNPRMNIEALFDVFGDLELGTSSHVELLGDINFEMDYQYYPSKRVDSTFDVFGDLELGTSSHVELLGDINFEMDYQYYPSKRVDSTFDVFGDLELGTSSHVELIGNVNFEMNGEAKPSENIYAGLLVTDDL